MHHLMKNGSFKLIRFFCHNPVNYGAVSTRGHTCTDVNFTEPWERLIAIALQALSGLFEAGGKYMIISVISMDLPQDRKVKWFADDIKGGIFQGKHPEIGDETLQRFQNDVVLWQRPAGSTEMAIVSTNLIIFVNRRACDGVEIPGAFLEDILMQGFGVAVSKGLLDPKVSDHIFDDFVDGFFHQSFVPLTKARDIDSEFERF